MNSSRLRRLVVALVTACAGAQVASGSALLASALALGLHSTDHAHSVSLVTEEGHLHLVLSHAERDAHHPGAARHHDDHAASTSESDHVFHLADGDATHTTLRRLGLDPAPALAMGAASPPAPTPVGLLRPSPESRARSSGPSRSVVLRL